ncbi:RNA polymerase sigma factor [Steroidobacter flavus]|uniref:RNA polymerase sigma factor n=1 Tax=Steroidobacter flavus TaxID=1842136 RepID=A0ABV8SNB9_9GAMM
MSNEGGFKLRELVRLHHRHLVRFVSAIVGNAQTAEDIAQDVYLKFSTRNVDATTVDYPKTYLFTAARNAAIDHTERLRTEQRHREWREDLSKVVSLAPTPEAQIHSQQRLQRMATALNELPAACREAFVLNKLQGLDHRVIAQRLGISVSMVEKHVMRALGHCRDRLREEEV